MACCPKPVLRVLTASANGLLVQASAASPRVSVVPGELARAGARTFVVPLANEWSDTSNEIELVFPQAPPVSFVEAARGRMLDRLPPAAAASGRETKRPGDQRGSRLDRPGRWNRPARAVRASGTVQPPTPVRAPEGDRADVPDELQDGARTAAEVTNG
jgi:hypothetical protein